MPIRDFESLMLPTLQALADGEEARVVDIRTRVADAENLTPEELKEKTPSGINTVFGSRISWALTYMNRAGLVQKKSRGVNRLDNEGQRLLSQGISIIDIKKLGTYPKFAEWRKAERNRSSKDKGTIEPISEVDTSKETPEETLVRSYGEMRSMLETDLFDRVLKSDPSFFEQIVVDLLIAMGYGGGDTDRGKVTGKTGDGGIDGTIQEDSLGLDVVYIQAKKYAENNTVSEGDLRNFAGAIDASGTTKGVFVTTSSFTKSAKSFVSKSPKRIRLIDGKELASLMVQHNVGVRTREQYDIKKIDLDYFDQDNE